MMAKKPKTPPKIQSELTQEELIRAASDRLHAAGRAALKCDVKAASHLSGRGIAILKTALAGGIQK